MRVARHRRSPTSLRIPRSASHRRRQAFASSSRRHTRHPSSGYVRAMIDEAIVARARAVAEELAPLIGRIESERRLPQPAVEVLVRANLFKLLVPREYGGLAAHPSTMLSVLEQIARIDGS